MFFPPDSAIYAILGFMSDEIEFKTSSETAPKRRPSDVPQEKEPTLLEELAEELARKIEKLEVEIGVPERPGVALRFSPNITQYQLRKWRKSAAKGRRDEIDSILFACTVVGQTCTGIYIHGEQVVDEEGYAITFGSPVLMKMTGTSILNPDAIRAFFGVDPHVEAVALAILEAAGYGEEVVTEENPTMMSGNQPQ